LFGIKSEIHANQFLFLFKTFNFRIALENLYEAVKGENLFTEKRKISHKEEKSHELDKRSLVKKVKV
jgi:hypothetical protein